jgi:hypothetical protein
MNADQIIARVRDLSFLATTSQFTDIKVLDSVNSALVALLGPAMGRTSGELLTEMQDVAFVTGQGAYAFPARSMLNTARVVTWVDSSGNERPPLKRLEPADAYRFAGSTGDPLSFVMSATGITLYPTPQSAGWVRFRYPKKMGSLVTDSLDGSNYHLNVWTIKAVDYLGTPYVLQVANSSLNPAGVWVGANLDVVSAVNPHKIYMMSNGYSAAVSGAGVNSITMNAISGYATAAALGIQVGDFITVAGTSYVPQAPDEWHELLILYGAARVAMLRKDYALQDKLMTEASLYWKEVLNAAQPRTKQNAKGISAWRGGYRFRHRW